MKSDRSSTAAAPRPAPGLPLPPARRAAAARPPSTLSSSGEEDRSTTAAAARRRGSARRCGCWAADRWRWLARGARSSLQAGQYQSPSGISRNPTQYVWKAPSQSAVQRGHGLSVGSSWCCQPSVPAACSGASSHRAAEVGARLHKRPTHRRRAAAGPRLRRRRRPCS